MKESITINIKTPLWLFENVHPKRESVYKNILLGRFDDLNDNSFDLNIIYVDNIEIG